MQFKCWGVRGSIPTPASFSFDTRLFGGNTTCYQIISGDMIVIIDAGSGIRLLGGHLMKTAKPPMKIHFFFSHVHWDHIQGFPFFSPALRRGNELTFYSPRLNIPRSHAITTTSIGSIIEEVLRGQQENPTFPLLLQDMPSRMEFIDLPPEHVIELEDDKVKLKVLPVNLNHPGGCYGYRFSEERKDGSGTSVGTVCTDHEHGKDISQQVQLICKNSSVLLYDAAYTKEEYEGIGTFSRKTWGHSTWEWGLKEAKAAGVKRLYLIHHDPPHDDTFVKEKIEKLAQAEGKKIGIQVECAQEGMLIDI